ncbi:cytochrome P450 3A4-like [Rhipicephalus sanguineus]|uniref:cytochrome P450 3A4-like n=1 Tax=Rhipicephalus sanguineus TaxID=34632 RepID=UPI001892FD7A|nr:cytochrome P450 3A4-like [Rhipicephalus sanguineus]
MIRKWALLCYDAFSWTTILITAAYVLFRLVRYRQKTFSYFKEIGIPGPEPNLIWGNLAEYHRKGFVHAITDWCAKYGDIFGFYNGDLPMLVVKDLDFLTYVFVKEFKNFTDRGVLIRTDQEHAVLSNSIVHAKGAEWKRARSCMSQAFTSNKLRHMMQDLVESADLFIETLGDLADAGQELAIHEPLQGLAMDYTGRAAFGLDCCFQRNPSHPFMQAARQVIHGVMTGPFHMIAHCTSTLGDIVAPILWLNEKLGTFSFSVFGEETKRVVEMRLRHPETRRPDLLQVMLDASERPNGADSRKKTSMTLQEVELNTTMTMFAGFETTSTAMAYVSYVLAKYQDVQEMVRMEVAAAIEEYGKLDYEAVTQGMKYLRSVVDETLRMYPVSILFTTRRAINDFEYNGVKYKAGTSIMAPTMNIHMDHRYWLEPHKFDPERFLGENAAYRASIAYQPFGVGPRTCIGERLAILAIMYTVARMVHTYRLTLGESQKKELEFRFYAAMAGPKHGPYIKFQRI